MDIPQIEAHAWGNGAFWLRGLRIRRIVGEAGRSRARLRGRWVQALEGSHQIAVHFCE